ncbi:GMC oxidoreductase [Gordonia sp. 852002-10350_SCH5691597]|uniref:GMC oxidoreductase n=1 Tax=Gordonia sp. 852002-10350_SCH5691597 TaxID=1834085 RepID=UPI000ABE1F49|nr:GMC oxidoreductase [Gordonia sp. 852002-10350_SCH5691597]
MEMSPGQTLGVLGESMDRRAFLKMSIAGAAAGGIAEIFGAGKVLAAPSAHGRYESVVPEIFMPVPAPRQHSEAIVIGSGFGGSVSALRLAEAGIQTTLLERGSRWPTDPWRDIYGSSDGRMFWHPSKSLAEKSLTSTLAIPAYAETLGSMASVDDFGGLFEVSWHNNSVLMCGAAVGGGSVVYIGITAQSLRVPFDQVFRGVVDYDEMARIWYPKALAGLGATTVPSDVYRHSSFDNARDFWRVAKNAKYSPYFVPGNWRWNVVRDEIAGRAKPMTITSAGARSNGSLNSLTFTYIPRAESTGKATVHPRHQVNDIHIERSGRFVLDVDYLSPYGDVLAKRILTTDRLVVAAGSLNTNRLLVKARDSGTLPNLNEYIGAAWGNNGNANFDVAVSGKKKDQSAVGAVGFFDTEGHYARCVVNSTYSLGPMESVVAASNTSVIKAGLTSVDPTRGVFRYRRDSGTVVLDWPAGGNGGVAANSMRIAHRLADRSGLPVDAVVYEPDLMWAHGLGGADLGTACDAYGRVKGYKNLYVNDGAMIPGSAGASNPTLTITAVAERNIAHIISQGG